VRHERYLTISDARGRRTPADVLVRAVRDHLFRTAADRFCAGMPDRAAALYLRTASTASIVRQRLLNRKMLTHRGPGWISSSPNAESCFNAGDTDLRPMW
jgi:hypothetical protein